MDTFFLVYFVVIFSGDWFNFDRAVSAYIFWPDLTRSALEKLECSWLLILEESWLFWNVSYLHGCSTAALAAPWIRVFFAGWLPIIFYLYSSIHHSYQLMISMHKLFIHRNCIQIKSFFCFLCFLSLFRFVWFFRLFGGFTLLRSFFLADDFFLLLRGDLLLQHLIQDLTWSYSIDAMSQLSQLVVESAQRVTPISLLVVNNYSSFI